MLLGLIITCLINVRPQAMEVMALAPAASIPQMEMDALHDLFNSTFGSDWLTFGVSWNFTGTHNPCTEGWDGIECTCLETDVDEVFPYIYGEPSYLYYYDDGAGVEEAPCHISKLILGFTQLGGVLPSSLGNLKFLSRLHMERNIISGSIPSSVGYISSLQYLVLSSNAISGPIPTSLGLLTALQLLALYSNQISGTLPTTLGSLTAMEQLTLYYNSLTGSLPESLGALDKLEVFYLFNNSLTGPIPSLSNATTMTFFALNNNFLTSSIPTFLGHYSQLYFLNLDNNYLTSSIPTSFGGLTNLVIFVIYNTLISGLIPTCLGYMINLEELYLNQNLLSGPIPTSLGSLASVGPLWIFSNHLTGPVPSTLRFITSLQLLLLYDNSLSGNLANAFDPALQLRMQVVDISLNRLTGTLPSALFQMPNLSTVAVIGNCLSGTLPSEICSAMKLQVLALDGLHTAPSCQDRFDSISDSYALQPSKSMRGTIPACLYSMPNLTTLHLTGNGLTGSIADTIYPTSRFVNLSLSNNILTGPIPQWVQNHQWTRLNLGYNRLSGSLSSSMQVGANSSLALDVNRLSGEIPASLVNVHNIDILEGNLFACSIDRASLPVDDPSSHSYSCGSDQANLSLIIWTVTFASFALFAVVVAVRLSKKIEEIEGPKSTKSSAKATVLPSLNFAVMVECLTEVIQSRRSAAVQGVTSVLGGTRKLTFVFVGLICCVLMPTYAVLSVFYKNHLNVYAWAVSVPFLSGTTPAVVVIVFWAVVVAVMCLVVADHSAWSAGHLTTAEASRRSEKHKPINLSKFCRRVLVWGALVMADIVIMGGLNAAYVLTVTSRSSFLSQTIILLQIVLGSIKGAWNALVLPRGFQLVLALEQRLVEDDGDGDGDRDQAADRYERGRNLVWLVFEWVVIGNNIVLPCVVVALVDPNCFLQVLVPAANIDASYSYVYCAIFGSSVTDCIEYVNVDVNVNYPPPFIYNYQCSASLLTNYAAVYVYSMIFTTFVAPIANWLYHGNQVAAKFRPERFTIQLVNLIAILATFGVAFPPLAVAVLAAVYGETYFAQVLMLSFVKMLGDGESALHARRREAVDKASLVMRDMLISSLWLLCPLAASFNAFFVFDMLGDEVGREKALGGLFVVMFGLPLSYGVIFLARRRGEAVSRCWNINVSAMHRGDELPHGTGTGAGAGAGAGTGVYNGQDDENGVILKSNSGTAILVREARPRNSSMHPAQSKGGGRQSMEIDVYNQSFHQPGNQQGDTYPVSF